MASGFSGRREMPEEINRGLASQEMGRRSLVERLDRLGTKLKAMMSNISKMLHDTAISVIRKMGG
jgi:hypothetical protein